jgi:hypothetical protein
MNWNGGRLILISAMLESLNFLNTIEIEGQFAGRSNAFDRHSARYSIRQPPKATVADKGCAFNIDIAAYGGTPSVILEFECRQLARVSTTRRKKGCKDQEQYFVKHGYLLNEVIKETHHADQAWRE